jgi:hypothetical protein
MRQQNLWWALLTLALNVVWFPLLLVFWILFFVESSGEHDPTSDFPVSSIRHVQLVGAPLSGERFLGHCVHLRKQMYCDQAERIPGDWQHLPMNQPGESLRLA